MEPRTDIEASRKRSLNEPCPSLTPCKDESCPSSQDKKRSKLEDQAAEVGLTEEEIQSFIENGFVLLKDAFPATIAAECRQMLWNRMIVDQIYQEDQSTWPERHGIAEIYGKEMGTPWSEVFTPRLKRAIDQLCGKGRWQEFGCGWWVINFPGYHDSPWGAAGKWHVDGARYIHRMNSKESGLLPIFLFSDLHPKEGGTALSVGSHRTVAKILKKHNQMGLRGGVLSRKASEIPRTDIIEVQGNAGDVMLTHPFLLHARSKNLGQRGVDSVRFMCNPNVALKEDMRLEEGREDYSPVEQAIRQSIAVDGDDMN